MNRFMGFVLTLLFLIAAPLTVLAEPGWQFCANENGFCDFRGRTEVRYGSEGRYVYKILSNGVTCSNEVFGDPTPGLAKNCFFRERERQREREYRSHWQICANENGFCDFRGRAEVRYGAGDRYVDKILSDGVRCGNEVFGDPAPGLPKNCYIMD